MRCAIVTGGTRGIGAAIAQALQAAGYRVNATYHGNEEAATCFRDKTGIPIHRCDVTDPEICAENVQHIEQTQGPIDILVNNAGIAQDRFFHQMDFAQWRAVLQTNLDSMFTMTRPVIPGMRARNFGRIINISSVNGQKGQKGQVNYAAAKAGIIGFTKALAQENARKGITVNAICPGYIETDMVAALRPDIRAQIIESVPLGRLGQPQEIGALALYLVSDSASFVTGATLNVNGGLYMM